MNHKKTNLRQNFGYSILVGSLFLSLLACTSKPVILDSNPVVLSNPPTSLIEFSTTKNNSISGIIVDSVDSTPLVGITVYIADSHSGLHSGLQEGTKKIFKRSANDLSLSSIGPDVDSKSCQKPIEPYIAYTCTNYWGAFYLNIANLRELPLRLKITNQRNTQEITLSLNDIGTNLGKIKLSPNASADSGMIKQKIAIVTDLLNPYREIQNSLSSEDIENIDLESMKLEIAEGFYELYEVDAENSLIEFPSFESLFSDKDKDQKADINNYEVVYINSLEEADISNLSDEYKRMLIDYVSKGGELYITSWSFELQEPGIDSYI